MSVRIQSLLYNPNGIHNEKVLTQLYVSSLLKLVSIYINVSIAIFCVNVVILLSCSAIQTQIINALSITLYEYWKYILSSRLMRVLIEGNFTQL